MTGQFDDEFIYNDEKYVITGINREILFPTKEYNLDAYQTCTACRRGYIAYYTLNIDQLVIDKLDINLKEPIVLNGKEPQKGNDLFVFTYNDLNLKLNFTGILLIAKDLIPGTYTHMGFQAPNTYKIVHELIFKNGLLQSITDISDKMTKERREKSPKNKKIKNKK